MIDSNKIKIFLKYEENVDNWVRNGSKKGKLEMTDNDWYLLNSFVQDIYLIKKGMASSSMIESIDKKLRENCDSEQTVRKLIEIVS